MASLGATLNDYGATVSRHRCDKCGDEFTVCPPVEDEQWGGCCLSEECSSYDKSRDIDKVWEGVQHLIMEERA